MVLAGQAARRGCGHALDARSPGPQQLYPSRRVYEGE